LMFRYDEEKVFQLDLAQINLIIQEIEGILKTRKIDVILFSDYNKGYLSTSLCQAVIKLANIYGIFTCVDPKNNYLKYVGCSLFKPNKNEVHQLFGIPFSMTHLKDIHAFIKEKVQCKVSVITLGELGISASLESNDFFSWCPEKKEVNDVTGAGDIVNAVLANFFTQLDNPKDAFKLASYLATLSVQHVGTYVLQFSDLVKAHKTLCKTKLINVDTLKRMKNPMVFTNGCFDILHEGHISLLNFCKHLAGGTHDVVVALNSDKSIELIKGPNRPICNQGTRVSIMNSLEQVDWILVFDEQTPLSLIEALHPDILVKGGDYTRETVVGKEYCRDVQIFPFVHAISSTKIIEKANEKRVLDCR